MNSLLSVAFFTLWIHEVLYPTFVRFRVFNYYVFDIVYQQIYGILYSLMIILKVN